MKVHERECVQRWSITDEAGASWESVPGRIYTCGIKKDDGSVMVFSNYWLRVPAGVMANPLPLGAKRPTKLSLWDNIKLRLNAPPMPWSRDD